MPARAVRAVRAADIANLALLHQCIWCRELFLDGRQAVPFKQVVDVNVLGAQPFKAAFTRPDKVMARHTFVIQSNAGSHPRLRSDQNIVPSAVQNLAKDPFRQSVGIHFCCFEKVHARVDAQVNRPIRFRFTLLSEHLGRTPDAKGESARCQDGHPEVRTAKGAIFYLFCFSLRAGCQLAPNMPHPEFGAGQH